MLPAEQELRDRSLLRVNYPILAHAVLLIKVPLRNSVMLNRTRREDFYQERRRALNSVRLAGALGLSRVEEKDVRLDDFAGRQHHRSEERRVGKECRTE